jgi:predicted small secreted protein
MNIIEFIICVVLAVSCGICIICAVHNLDRRQEPMNEPVRSVFIVDGEIAPTISRAVIEIMPYRNNTINYPVYTQPLASAPELVEDDGSLPTPIAVLIQQI